MNRRFFLGLIAGLIGAPLLAQQYPAGSYVEKLVSFLRQEERSISIWLDSKDGKDHINFLTGKAKGWWFSSDNGRKQYDAVYWGILTEAGITRKPTQIGEWVKWMKAQDPDPVHGGYWLPDQTSTGMEKRMHDWVVASDNPKRSYMIIKRTPVSFEWINND
jgi:hypothetical protein